VTRRAAIYCRISQAPDGTLLGVERQEPPCRRLCEQRGWEIVETFVDNDLSASRFARKPRPAYQRMLEAARAHEITAIVVVDPDRLTRRPVENEEIIDYADRYGIALANVAGDINLATATGRLQFRMLGAVAAHESELKSERVKRKVEQKAHAGEDHGGVRSFGRAADRVSLHPVEAPLLAGAARELLAGGTLKSVVAGWNAQGIRTTRGQTWGPSSLRRLLVSPRLYGARAHNGQVAVHDAFPAIVDRQTWQQLHALLTDPLRRKGTPARYLLSGLAVCYACERGLVGDPQRGRPFYGCRGQRLGCGRVVVNAQALDELIVEGVLQRLDGDGYARACALLAKQDPEWQRLAERQRADEIALAELAHARFTERTIEHRDYLVEFAKLTGRVEQARVAGARRVRSGVLEELRDEPGGIRVWWVKPSTTLERRRAVIGAIADRIVVGPGRPHRFDPARVLPPYGPQWRDEVS
jgi:site-specific DNA recombinase